MSGRKLGEGSYGRVDEGSIAVKTLDSSISFMRESTCLWRLKYDEGVVKILDSNFNTLTIKLERYECNLRDAMENLSMEDKEIIARSITGTLYRMHYMGMMHGDIKPDNILLNTYSLEVVIADLGNSSIRRFCKTEKGNYFYKGTDPIREFSQDVYSMGIVLLEMFSGYRITRAGVLPHVKALYPNLTNVALERKCPHSGIISRMVSANPDQRPSSLEVCREFGYRSVDIVEVKLKTYDNSTLEKLFRSIAGKHNMHRPKTVFSATMGYITMNKVHDNSIYTVAGAIIGCCIYTNCSLGSSWTSFLPENYDIAPVKMAISRLLEDRYFCSNIYNTETER